MPTTPNLAETKRTRTHTPAQRPQTVQILGFASCVGTRACSHVHGTGMVTVSERRWRERKVTNRLETVTRSGGGREEDKNDESAQIRLTVPFVAFLLLLAPVFFCYLATTACSLLPRLHWLGTRRASPL